MVNILIISVVLVFFMSILNLTLVIIKFRKKVFEFKQEFETSKIEINTFIEQTKEQTFIQ